MLVEDTWTSDSAGAPAENHRAWRSPSGGELRTSTVPVSHDPELATSARISDALAGAVMELLVSNGSPRDGIAEAVKDARAATPKKDAGVFMINGDRPDGISATSGEITARCAIVGTTLVIAFADDIAMTLAPAGPASGLA